MSLKIGVMLESFKCDVIEAIKKAAELGVDGIQFYGVSGELDCDKLTDNKKSELKSLLIQHNLQVSAVCADLGGYGFEIAENNHSRIEKTCRVMDLAKEMDCSVVTTHIGVIPLYNCVKKQTLSEACEKIGEYGEKIGVKLAIETGPELVLTLKSFLDELKTEYVGVNYDPANLVMVTGDDPVQGVYALKNRILHTHAKDGIMKNRTDPKIIYDYFAEGGIGDLRLDDYFKETPLGKGDVDFKGWINALEDIGYTGFLTIERETGEMPYEDIKIAVDYIKKYL